MSEHKSTKRKDKFSSQLGIVLAAAGSAIGIGNIWRFSYVVGTNGGGAFLLIYLVCVILVGLPLIMAELTLGRNTAKSAVTAFKVAAPKTPWWLVGALGVLTTFLILSYYPLIAGWSLGYFFEGIFNWEAMTANTSTFFDGYVAGNVKPVIMLALVLILTALSLLKGVSKGIEKVNKVLMPMLVVLIVVLIVRSLTLKGASKGLEFLFKPDFKNTNLVKAVLEALGHGFYSLSVGMAIMITYGSYVRKEDDLIATSVNVCALDTVTAVMAGLAIFPAVFALGFDPASGPGLAFVTIPSAFATMFGGQIFAILFFLLLTVAALASLISLVQVLVGYLEDEWHIKKKSVMLVIITALLFFCGLAAVFKDGYIDFIDHLTANILVPLTGLFTAIFVGFKYLKPSTDELLLNAKRPNGILAKSYPVLIKYVVPICIIIVFMFYSGLFDLVAGLFK